MPHPVPMGTVARWRWSVGGAVLLSIALRLRFVVAPIGSDEGGFLAIARAWRHGADLYEDVWVDRPQGLLVVYRAYDFMGGGVDSVRVLALAFGSVCVVAVAEGVRCIAGQRPGVVAAWFVAALSASPAIEGYAANGELLSGAMSAVAVALAAGVLVGRRPTWWMALAGVFGALGWSIKQSGVDGLAAVGAVLVIGAALRWWPVPVACRHLARLIGGVLLVAGVVMTHGVLTGWAAWRYAVAGYRMEQRSLWVDANWDRLLRTAADAGVVFLPILIAGLVAGVIVRRGSVRLVDHHAGVIFLIWPFTAAMSFLLGGQFFHHYWIILAGPVGAASGIAVGRLNRPRTVRWIALLAVLPLVGSAVSIAGHRDATLGMAVDGDTRSFRAEAAGSWLRHRMREGETLYVMCAAAQTYAHAGVDPVYRYLWWDGVHQAEGAQHDLEELFTGARRPEWVAAFDAPRSCTGSAAVARVMRAEYRQAAVVSGVRILERIGGASTAAPVPAGGRARSSGRGRRAPPSPAG